MQKYPDKDNSPEILYLADFLPANLNGGTLLLRRLLSGYPNDRIIVFCGSTFMELSPAEERLNCPHIVFPATNGTGPWGIGRLKKLVNYGLIPFLTVAAACVLLVKKPKVIVSVADGYFFFVAAFLSVVTSTPLVLFVHDLWLRPWVEKIIFLKSVNERIFAFILKRAKHIYAISPSMCDFLLERYNVVSSLQLPSFELVSRLGLAHKPESGCISIGYAGNIEHTALDNLEILFGVLKENILENRFNFKSVRLYIYTRPSQDLAERIKASPNLSSKIVISDWLSEDKLLSELKNMDILFLPFSFRSNQRDIVSTSMPAKIAIYLASGRPILVFAPAHSSLAKYANTYGLAEVVSHPDENALAEGIRHIISSESYGRQLSENALKTFALNHNISKQRQEFKDTIFSLAAQAR